MMDELLSLIKENPRLTNAELAAALGRDEAQVANSAEGCGTGRESGI